MARHILAHHLRTLEATRAICPTPGGRIFYAQQLHRVHVDHTVQPRHGIRVRIGALGVLHPGVRPAQTPPLELLGDQRAAVGPGVHEDQVEVGDPASRESRLHLRVCPQHPIAFLELVDGEVRLHVRDQIERFDGLIGEAYHRLVGQVLGTVETDDDRPSCGDGAVGLVRGELGLTRLGEFDGAYRHPSPTPCSRERTAETARNSSAESGSSGCIRCPLSRSGFRKWTVGAGSIRRGDQTRDLMASLSTPRPSRSRSSPITSGGRSRITLP